MTRLIDARPPIGIVHRVPPLCASWALTLDEPAASTTARSPSGTTYGPLVNDPPTAQSVFAPVAPTSRAVKPIPVTVTRTGSDGVPGCGSATVDVIMTQTAVHLTRKEHSLIVILTCLPPLRSWTN